MGHSTFLWFFAINCGLLIIDCSSVIFITADLKVLQKIEFIIKQQVAASVLSEVEVLGGRNAWHPTFIESRDWSSL